MNQEKTLVAEHSSISKNVTSSVGEIETHHLSDCIVGYLVSGEKYIYGDNVTQKIAQGELFFLGTGCHYTREVPTGGVPYEELLVRYSADDLQRLLLHLNLTYKIAVPGHSSCENCNTSNPVSMPAWAQVRIFFRNLDECLRERILQHDPVAENLKMTELLYWMISYDDCCLRNRLLQNVDSSRDSFQHTIHAHIFDDISVEGLAGLCNRSLTSFKKEFARNFKLSPHQWFIRQRLIHARLLLISTDKSISQVGVACAFPNISHFIKLFRKQYEMTPAQYRTRYCKTENPVE